MKFMTLEETGWTGHPFNTGRNRDFSARRRAADRPRAAGRLAQTAQQRNGQQAQAAQQEAARFGDEPDKPELAQRIAAGRRRIVADEGNLPAQIDLRHQDLDLQAGEPGDAQLPGVDETRIEGNAEFAEALGFVFRHLRWDAEEDLSRVVGDIAAHRLVDGGRRIATEGRRSLERAGGSVAEYLTEESPVLVPRAALPAFAQEVVALRDAVARLDKRVARLEKR